MAEEPDGEDGLELVESGRRRDRSARLGLVNTKPSELDKRLAQLEMSDKGNAERFRAREGENVMFVRHRGWHGWDDATWNGERGEELAALAAQRVQQGMKAEINALKAKDPNRAAFLVDHCVNSGNIGKLKGMLEVAQPHITRPPDILDRDPYLLYMANGAMRLHPSQRLVPRDRAHYVSRQASAKFDEAASCPKWERFTEQVLPDPSVRAFVQRALGASLTGDTSDETFFLCWGLGRNGKGVLLRTVATVLGTYAATIPIELLLKKTTGASSGNEAQPHFAQLPGVRFVTPNEPNAGATFDEGLLKSLTGRDHLRVRDMYGKPFEFIPQFKLWIAVNDRPNVRSCSEAYWRRVLVIPFTRTFAPDEIDQHLESELAQEGSGILNWLLEGAAEWSSRGLAPPTEIAAAVAEYRADQDPLETFLASCVTVGDSVASKDLLAVYEEWCAERAITPMKSNPFGRALTSKGFKRQHANGTLYSGRKLSDAGAQLLRVIEERERKLAASKRLWPP